MNIRGLDNFQDFFKGYENFFVLIGGAATLLILEETGVRRKGTKDLDIVFILESEYSDFLKRFKEYIELGEYITKTANGKPQYYRFEQPKSEEYPIMIEIFSRESNTLFDNLFEKAIKISIEEEIMSLSALILDDDYYEFVKQNTNKYKNIHIANEESLVVLKMYAYNNLLIEKEKVGSHVKMTDIKKHRNDVLKISQNFPTTKSVKVNKKIQNEIEIFFKNLHIIDLDLKSLEIDLTEEEILQLIRRVFGLYEEEK